MSILSRLQRLFTGKPSGEPKPSTKKKRRGARAAARAALRALTPKPAAQAATYRGKPATGQWADADRPADPWYRDDRRKEAGGRPWIEPRPNWLDPGNGRRAKFVTASLMTPGGETRSLPAPDYTPIPFDAKQ